MKKYILFLILMPFFLIRGQDSTLSYDTGVIDDYLSRVGNTIKSTYVSISDTGDATDDYFFKMNSLTSYLGHQLPDWYGYLTNSRINISARPDQVMRWMSYNTGKLGGLLDTSDIGMSGIEMETHYEPSDSTHPYAEIHYGVFYAKPNVASGLAVRPFTSVFRKDIVRTETGLAGDYLEFTTSWGNDYFAFSDSANLYVYNGLVTNYNRNNAITQRQLNNAGNSYLNYPYYDFNDEYIFPAVKIKVAGGADFQIDSSNIALDNAYQLGFYKADNTTFRNAIQFSDPGTGYETLVIGDLSETNQTLSFRSGNGSVFEFTDGSASRFFTIYPSGSSVTLGPAIGNGDYTFYVGTIISNNIQPETDNTYYLGKNDDDTPLAWKGLILKDQTTGAYYRLELNSGSLSIVDLSD